MKRAAFLTSQQMFFAFFTFLVVLAGIGIIGYALTKFQIDDHAVDKVRYELRARQLVNNPACFAYEDMLGRHELFVIDKQKFNENILSACLLTQTTTGGIQVIPAQAILYDKETTIINSSKWMGDNSMTLRYSYPIFIQDGNDRREGSIALKLTKVYVP